MKIIIVDNNYGVTVDSYQEPAWYLLTHSCLHRDNKPLYIPDWDDEFRLFPSMAVRIDRLGKSIPSRFAHRYYDFWSFGFTLRGMSTLNRLKKAGLPLGGACAFDTGAIIAPEWHKISSESFDNESFEICDDTGVISKWSASSLILKTDDLISRLSERMTFKTGDILYLGCPADGILINKDFKIIVNRRIKGETDTIFKEICGFNIRTYPHKSI